MMNAPFSEHEALTEFSRILRESDLRAALAYLLSLTEYRYIAIFRFEHEMTKSLIYIDRDDPDIKRIDDAEISASYCCYVRDTKGVFTTANAMADDRTVGHPKREILASYCGVPILDSEGEILGTICHFDAVPRDPTQINLPLMLSVASALSREPEIRSPSHTAAN
jgi:GAF domain-containing protein